MKAMHPSTRKRRKIEMISPLCDVATDEATTLNEKWRPAATDAQRRQKPLRSKRPGWLIV
jgi:hypothetical protein